MVESPFGNLIFVSPVQDRKAPSPIELTLVGIVSDVNNVQLRNASLPIDCKLFGRVMLLSLRQL